MADFRKIGIPKKTGKEVEGKCTRHSNDRRELIPLASRRHQAQKTGYPVLIWFQKVRSLNKKVEEVLESIRNHKWM